MMFSLDISMKIVLLTVLGGIGSVYGPIIGAAIFIPLSEFTRIRLGVRDRHRPYDIRPFDSAHYLLPAQGVIGIAGRIAEKFGRKPTGGEGGVETVS